MKVGIIKTNILIFLLWMLISQDFEILAIAKGVLVSLVINRVLIKMLVINSTSKSSISVMQFIKYIFNLIHEILLSGLHIVKLIFNNDSKLESSLETITIRNLNKKEKLLVANLVTMTPGTVVISVDKDEFLIHSIDKHSKPKFSHEEIHNFIKAKRFKSEPKDKIKIKDKEIPPTNDTFIDNK